MSSTAIRAAPPIAFVQSRLAICQKLLEYDFTVTVAGANLLARRCAWSGRDRPRGLQQPGDDISPCSIEGEVHTLKHIVLLSSIIVAVSCQPKIPPFSGTIGILSMTGGKGCFEISNPSIPANSRVSMIEINGGQASEVARLGKKDPSCSNAAGNSPAAVAYDVYFDSQPPAEMPAIGILNFRGRIIRDGDLVSADINGYGQTEYFRSCTSTEGVHFTVWSGKPIVGKLRWHQYYYLGYDVSPTCTKSETTSE
jgi:hypothetical protein